MTELEYYLGPTWMLSRSPADPNLGRGMYIAYEACLHAILPLTDHPQSVRRYTG